MPAQILFPRRASCSRSAAHRAQCSIHVLLAPREANVAIFGLRHVTGEVAVNVMGIVRRHELLPRGQRRFPEIFHTEEGEVDARRRRFIHYEINAPQ